MGSKRSTVSAIGALPKILMKKYLFELILAIVYPFCWYVDAKTFRNVFFEFFQVKVQNCAKKLPLTVTYSDALTDCATKALEKKSGF